jgi:hypothetical protein
MNIENSKDICVICIDNIDITDLDISKIDCNHIFHKNCIDEWLNINKKCPICIQEIQNYKSSIIKDNNIQTISNTSNTSNTTNRLENRYNTCSLSCMCIIFIVLIIISIVNLLFMPMIYNFINKYYYSGEIINNICVNYTGNNNSDIFDFGYSYIINLIYIIYVLISVTSVFSIKNFLGFAIINYIPFGGWYSYIIINYIRIFDYLDKIKETNCENNLLDIINIKKSSLTIFSLINIIFGLYIILITFIHFNIKINRVRPQ